MKNLMKKAREAQKDERGLTLVELLAVVVILAIVAAIAFVLIGNVIDNSKADAHIANAQQVIGAVKLAEASDDVTWTVSGDTATLNVFTAGVSNIETLGSILDPWDKTAYATAEVTKKDKVYSITLPNGTKNGGKCTITGRSETDLQTSRKVACGTTSPTDDEGSE